MLRSLLEFIVTKSQGGEPIAVITRLGHDGGSIRFAVTERGDCLSSDGVTRLPAEVVKSAIEMASSKTPTAVIESPSDIGNTTYIIDVIKQKPSLVVFGAGHVGQAVGLIGALLGYEVTVIDDREEFVSRSRFPDQRIKLTQMSFDFGAGELSLNPNTAVVIVTRGHQFDELCLSKVVGSNAGYVGMIGSKRRVMSVFARLRHMGIPASKLDGVHAPIGLKIGAKSPQEIAVAIMAEVIACLNGFSSSEKS